MHPKLLAFVMIPDEEWDSTKEVTRLPSLFLLAESWGNEIVYAELEEDVDGSSKPQLSFSSYLASISPNFNKPQKKKRIDALVRLRDLFHSNYYPSLVQWWIFSLHKKAKYDWSPKPTRRKGMRSGHHSKERGGISLFRHTDR